MKWTDKRPEEPGWYWFRFALKGDGRAPICQRYVGEYSALVEAWDVTDDDLRMFSEWLGPIHPEDYDDGDDLARTWKDTKRDINKAFADDRARIGAEIVAELEKLPSAAPNARDTLNNAIAVVRRLTGGDDV